jgi:hypothetical protein
MNVFIGANPPPSPSQIQEWQRDHFFPVKTKSNAQDYQSSKLEVVEVQRHWVALRKEFEMVDDEIFDFEQSQKIKRDGKTATTFEELNSELDKLKFPESIKRLYIKRQDRWMALRILQETYPEYFKERFANIDTTLPAAPQLPKPTVVGVSISGGSSQ